MQFQVPQFTEVETKLIGPLTLKQFLWLAGGAAIFYILSFMLTGTALIVALVIIGGISCTFAFATIGGVSPARYTLYALKFALGLDHYEYQTNQKDKYAGEERVNTNY